MAGYGTAMLLSYLIGQRKYPIDYQLPRLMTYVLATAALYCVMSLVTEDLNTLPRMAANTALIVAYLALFVVLERPHIER